MGVSLAGGVETLSKSECQPRQKRSTPITNNRFGYMPNDDACTIFNLIQVVVADGLSAFGKKGGCMELK